MADSRTMSQQRPPSAPHQTSPSNFTPSHSSPIARSGFGFPANVQHGAPSPPAISNYQIGAQKRAQFSPDAQSPYGTQTFSPVGTPQSAGTPVNGLHSAIGQAAPTAPGLMGPPTRPMTKQDTDIRGIESVLAATGVDLEDEERQLISSYPSFGNTTQSSSFQSGSFGSNAARPNFDRPQNLGSFDNSFYGNEGGPGSASGIAQTPEEIEARRRTEANFKAAKEHQHPMWNLFLQGDPLEKKLNDKCYENGIKAPKDGLFYATKSANRPPQTTQVNGRDGASRIINQGQTILSTQSGETLIDIMNLLALATKERVTGILDLSARLAQERKAHSTGRIPTEWEAVAVPVQTPAPELEAGDLISRKRSHSQMTRESASANIQSAPQRISEMFRKLTRADKVAEEARIAKRARRNLSASADTSRQPSISTPGAPATPGAAPAATNTSEKKTTKKDRKAQESKLTEAQQHRSSNETANMALGSILGSKKKYSWMTGGASTPKPIPSPSSSASKSAVAAKDAFSQPGARIEASKERVYGHWDESRDRGIRPRDVLLVLETDGKAPRALLKGYNIPENRE